MVRTGFHGGTARDLQPRGLHTDEACGRGELERSLLDLATGGEGRNALSLPPLLTCGEDKAFFSFIFTGVLRGRENRGFRGIPG